MFSSPFFRAVLVSLSISSLGCGGGGESAAAEDADDSVNVTSNESALTAEMVDEVDQPDAATADQLAASAVTKVPAHFTPSSCVTAMQQGPKVTYTLTNCTGRYGLVSVTGVVTAVYSRAAGGGVDVVLTSTGLKANQATLDVNATVRATEAGSVRTAKVDSTTKGTGPRGTTLTHDGDYTVVYDRTTECLTVNGTWSTGVGTKSSTTTVTNFARCKGACPTSGTIVHDTVRGSIVTVTYSGAATASWATSAGRSGTLSLMCQK